MMFIKLHMERPTSKAQVITKEKKEATFSHIRSF